MIAAVISSVLSYVSVREEKIPKDVIIIIMSNIVDIYSVWYSCNYKYSFY